MIRDRKDYPRLRTPRAPSIYPALNEPDYKFKKDTGEYHARLRFKAGDPAWEPLVSAAQEILDEAFEAKKAELTREKKGALLKDLNKAQVVREEVDPETGDPTGYMIFRAAVPARVDIKNGPKAGTSFTKKPDLFDKAGKQLKNPPKIGSGSELKLSVVPMDYWFPKDKTIGVSFELEGAQILKLIVGGQRDADYYGFEEEDGDEIEDGEEPTRSAAFDDESGDDNGDF